MAVLNGCGERGIGDQFSSFLNNNYGLIITRTENAKDEEGENKFDYESTKVIIINENNTNIENIMSGPENLKLKNDMLADRKPHNCSGCHLQEKERKDLSSKVVADVIKVLDRVSFIEIFVS